jgi:hypothetical protein
MNIFFLYFQDYFAVNKTDWVLDTIDPNEDDWEQIEYSSYEVENITFCSITRAFKTQNVTEGEDREIKVTTKVKKNEIKKFSKN